MRQAIQPLLGTSLLTLALNAVPAWATDPGQAVGQFPTSGGAASVGTGALPTNGTVVAGQIGMASTASALTVAQTSPRGIIDWGGFSIGAGAIVRFENGSGATLNRVTGPTVSMIDGSLSATGSVYLLNPNGVIVGRNGVVDVGGRFVATTLALGNSAFLAGGDLTLSATSTAAVVQLGRVSALGGDVALVARTVRNEGSISAPNGSVGLLAGSSVLLRDAAVDGGKFAVLVGGYDASATNIGMIEGAVAELRANGGSVYALAGATGGLIRATGVSNHGGRIFLVAEGGDATVAGRLEAEDAAGGAGFVETSGNTVALGEAHVDAHGGTWLIDPTDLAIDRAAAISISGALNGGTNVTERTTSGGASGVGVQSAGAGDITVAASIGWSSSAILTLDAYHGIAINAPVTASGAGRVDLRYNDGGNSGELTFAPASNIDFTGLPGMGQSLAINGQAYALVYSFVDLALANGATGFHALARNLTAPPVAYATAVVGNYGGTFEGLGHTIADLSIDAGSAVSPIGLFGSLSGTATVRDLGIAGGTIRGADQVGGVAGFSAGTLVNVASSATVNGRDQIGGVVGYSTGAVVLATASAPVSGRQAVGGVIGAARGSVAGSQATAAVSGTSFVGGLVGYDFAVIGASGATKSSAAGDVTGSYYVGGLAGIIVSQASIEAGSSASGRVSGTDIVGGLLGWNSNGTVTGATATGHVTGQTLIGGLVGGNDGTITLSTASGQVAGTGAYIGGLVGSNGMTITDSFALQTGDGAVSGPTNVGGLAGGNTGRGTISGGGATGGVSGTDSIGGLVGINSTSISNAYAAGKVSGRNDVGGLVGYSTGTITLAVAQGTVMGNDGVGGLVGANTGAITGSSTTSSATVNGRSYVGGLVGDNLGQIAFASSGVTSSALGNVTGTYFVGGLVGMNRSRASSIGSQLAINLVFASGTVSGVGSIGGLVGFNLGSIRGVTASGAVSGGSQVGGLVGTNYGTIGDFVVSGTISAQIPPTTASGAVSGNETVGGLVGRNAGEVRYASVTSSVTGESNLGGLAGTNVGYIHNLTTGATVAGGQNNIGGLVGNNSGLIDSVEVTAFSRVSGQQEVGGLVGINTSTGTIRIATSRADVTGSDGEIGGLVGFNSGFVTTQSRAFGSVSGLTAVGGLIGFNFGTVAASAAAGTTTASHGTVGGLVGSNNGVVTGSTSSGAVSGVGDDGYAVGGLIGYNNGTVGQALSTSDVVGMGSVGGLVGLNRATIIGSEARGTVTGDDTSRAASVGVGADYRLGRGVQFSAEQACALVGNVVTRAGTCRLTARLTLVYG